MSVTIRSDLMVIPHIWLAGTPIEAWCTECGMEYMKWLRECVTQIESKDLYIDEISCTPLVEIIDFVKVDEVNFNGRTHYLNNVSIRLPDEELAYISKETI